MKPIYLFLFYYYYKATFQYAFTSAHVSHFLIYKTALFLKSFFIEFYPRKKDCLKSALFIILAIYFYPLKLCFIYFFSFSPSTSSYFDITATYINYIQLADSPPQKPLGALNVGEGKVYPLPFPILVLKRKENIIFCLRREGHFSL